MNISELYQRYTNAYEIELRECSTSNGIKLLKDIHLLENLSLEEFEEKLKESEFNYKWGDDTNSNRNFMYNWIRSKSGK